MVEGGLQEVQGSRGGPRGSIGTSRRSHGAIELVWRVFLSFIRHICLYTEIDMLVSKLLGFETFAKSLRVSVSENLVSEKKSWFRFRKNLVSEKSLGFGFRKFGLGRKVSVRFQKKFGL